MTKMEIIVQWEKTTGEGVGKALGAKGIRSGF